MLGQLVPVRVIGISCLLLWWLALFIEALVLSPNIEREGSNNGHFERGQLVQAILTKRGLRLSKVLVVMSSWDPW